MAESLSSLSSSTSALPTIYSISGCIDDGNTTHSCDLNSVITITGVNLNSIDTVTIDGQSVSGAFIQPISTTQIIVRKIPGWFYYFNSLSPVIVKRRTESSDEFYGISFILIQPMMNQLNGCQGAPLGERYSIASCKTGDLVTISGVNFFEYRDYSFGVQYSIGNGELRFQNCIPMQFSLNFLQIICEIGWLPSDMPNGVLYEWVMRFGVSTPRVIRAVPNGRREIKASFFNPQTSSSSSSSALSMTSSSSEVRPVLPPRLTRISGCEDVTDPAITGTINCPRVEQRQSPLELVLYGDALKWPSPSMRYNVSINGVHFPDIVIRMPGLDYMTIELIPGDAYSRLPVGPWLSLTLAWNSTLLPSGSSTIKNAIRIMTGNPPNPIISRVSGCFDLPSFGTVNCSYEAALTITGTGFVLYEPMTMSLNDPRSSWESMCTTRRKSPGALICYLPPPPPNIAPDTFFSIRLVWRSSGGTWSVVSAPNTLSYAWSRPEYSSTGTDQPPESLDTMYYALLVIMIIALGVLGIATCIYFTTWWQAQRRAFVSSTGAAAVDMRQVLLN